MLESGSRHWQGLGLRDFCLTLRDGDSLFKGGPCSMEEEAGWLQDPQLWEAAGPIAGSTSNALFALSALGCSLLIASS